MTAIFLENETLSITEFMAAHSSSVLSKNSASRSRSSTAYQVGEYIFRLRAAPLDQWFRLSVFSRVSSDHDDWS